MQEAEKVNVHSIQDFCQEFLSPQQVVTFRELLNSEHTWGDTDLVAISGDTLVSDLRCIGCSIPSWLEEHREDLFEISNMSDSIWEDMSEICSGCPN